MIHYDIDAKGLALLRWDMPGRSQNVINAESCAALVETVARVATDSRVRGVVLSSAKPDFCAGGDLEWLLSATEAQQLFDRTCQLHQALRQLETCGKPVAMALPGSALGGGLEIALAGHYRVAASNPKARFGLPEVTLGLLPGGGGTQRLPRLIGVQAAMPLLLEGKRLGTAEALKAGILHAVVEPGTELEAARAWVLAQVLAQTAPVQQPWDAKGYKIPGGAIASPAVQQVFTAGNAMLRARTQGNYPAPAAIMSCVYEGLITDIDTGLKTEARYFTHTVLSTEAKNMIRTLFFNMNEANKLAARPAGVSTQACQKVAILGAGMMGAGIAYVTAKAGIQAVLLDVNAEAAERGKAYSSQLLDKQVARGKLSADKAAALLARIQATDDYALLDGVDLVIEAVFEDRGLKAEVTRKSEARMPAKALFASNTSTLPITGLAKASSRPEQFIGLHFFSPVDKMPLVEVIMGEQTSPETLARALDYVKAIGMTPIVVNDSRGFYTSRVFQTYVFEGLAMLAEGVAPALIENAGLKAGMPVGPLALTDEVSAELCVKIDKQTRTDLGEGYVAPAGLEVAQRVVELGRIGRKAGQGFYDYPKDGKKSLWPGLGAEFPQAAQQPAVEELVQRLVAIQAVEAARCMQEGVLTTARDADVGALLGWGFPAFRGGPIGQIHSVGVGAFVAQCEALAQRHGARFDVPALLKDMAREGRSFYI
ncbi:MAG: enoyl-CoA hydratase/isomerase family protein [Burkholderiaceae bacterium]|nr:enoyl-CoA hydratase/isomerase family protein [Burkholderiaceae bacterium]